MYVFICYIYRLKIYILKRYDMPDLLSKKTPWHSWNVKGFFRQNICRKRHEQSQLRFDRNGQIRTMTNIKTLTREIIVSETSQILQIYLLFKNRNAEKRLHAFARIEGSWKKTIITGNCNVPFNTVLKFAYLKVHTVLAIIGIFCGLVTLLFFFLVTRQKEN